MRVREILPVPGDAIDLHAEDGRARLGEIYALPDAAYVRLNMITTPTGSAAGADGTSDTLTSATDRAVLGVIRRAADVVVVGAASVRAEGYVIPRSAALAIVTRSGALDGHRLGEAGGRVLLVCPAAAAAEVRQRSGLHAAEVIAVSGSGDLAPAAIVAALRERGLTRIVCEGGPSLAAQFADADVIDEYCLTVAPAIEPAAHPVLPVTRPVPTFVAGVLVDDAGFSYLRLRPRR